MSPEHGPKRQAAETKNKHDKFTRLSLDEKEGQADFYQKERRPVAEVIRKGGEKIAAFGRRMKERWDKRKSFKLSSIDSEAYENKDHWLNSHLDKAKKAEKIYREIAQEGEKLQKDKQDVVAIAQETKAKEQAVEKPVDNTEPQEIKSEKKEKTEAQKRLSDVAEILDKYPVLNVKFLNSENSRRQTLAQALENGTPSPSWVTAAEKGIQQRLKDIGEAKPKTREILDLEKALNIISEFRGDDSKDIKKKVSEKNIAKILKAYPPQYYKKDNVAGLAAKFESGGYDKADASRALGALGYIKLNNKKITPEDMQQLQEAENFLVKVANRMREPNRTEIPVAKEEENTQVKQVQTKEKQNSQSTPEQGKPKAMARGAGGGR